MEDSFQKFLQCKICFELWRNPVALSCSHVFCEKCIHEHFERKSECPYCHNRIQKDRMIRMMSLDELVREYRKKINQHPTDQEIPVKPKKDEDISDIFKPVKRKREDFERMTLTQIENRMSEINQCLGSKEEGIRLLDELEGVLRKKDVSLLSVDKFPVLKVILTSPMLDSIISDKLKKRKKREIQKSEDENDTQSPKRQGNTQSSVVTSRSVQGRSSSYRSPAITEKYSTPHLLSRINESEKRSKKKSNVSDQIIPPPPNEREMLPPPPPPPPPQKIEEKAKRTSSSTPATEENTLVFHGRLEDLEPRTPKGEVKEEEEEDIEMTKNQNNNVYVYSCLSKEEVKLVKQFTKTFGGTVSQRFTPHVTHVITKSVDQKTHKQLRKRKKKKKSRSLNLNRTKSRKCKRTMKYCLGVLQGSWVVSLNWVRKSMQMKKMLPEMEFVFVGDSNTNFDHPLIFKKHLFGTSKQKTKKKKKTMPERLFSNLRFILVFKDKTMEKNIRNLVVNGGGEILESGTTKKKKKKKKRKRKKRRKKMDDEEDDEDEDDDYDDEDKTLLKLTDYAKKERSKMGSEGGCKILLYGWVFDSISDYSLLDFDVYM